MDDAEEQPDVTRRRSRPRRALVTVAALVIVAVVAGVLVSALRTGPPSAGEATAATAPGRATTSPAAGPSTSDAAVVVTPAVRLRSGQVVTATASGFDPGTTVSFMECLPLKVDPNPAALADGDHPAESTTMIDGNEELGTCRWPSGAPSKTPTTGSGPSRSATATVGADGRVSVSMAVADTLSNLSGLGAYGQDIEYLLMGPVACDQWPAGPTGAGSDPASSTTASADGADRRGCQVVVIGERHGRGAIRASDPLDFIGQGT